jgi:hypothetical protein
MWDKLKEEREIEGAKRLGSSPARYQGKNM